MKTHLSRAIFDRIAYSFTGETTMSLQTLANGHFCQAHEKLWRILICYALHRSRRFRSGETVQRSWPGCTRADYRKPRRPPAFRDQDHLGQPHASRCLSSVLSPESSPLGTRPRAYLCGDLDVAHLRPTARTSGRLHTCLAQTWLWRAPPGEMEEGRGPGAWLESLRRFATVHTS